uniref:FANCI solenoid 4 domain-containing protein n=1 Tax=Fundulus heteroclitus TaxID=8078 RepID=A0A146S2T4_FUNHE
MRRLDGDGASDYGLVSTLLCMAVEGSKRFRVAFAWVLMKNIDANLANFVLSHDKCWPELKAKIIGNSFHLDLMTDDVDVALLLEERPDLVLKSDVVERMITRFSGGDLFAFFSACSLHKVYESVWRCLTLGLVSDAPLLALVEYVDKCDLLYGAGLLKKSGLLSANGALANRPLSDREFALCLCGSRTLTPLKGRILRLLTTPKVASWLSGIAIPGSVMGTDQLEQLVSLSALSQPGKLCSFMSELMLDEAAFEFVVICVTEIASHHSCAAFEPFLRDVLDRAHSSQAAMGLLCRLMRNRPHLLKPHVVGLIGPRIECGVLVARLPVGHGMFVSSAEHLMAISSVMRRVVYDLVKRSLLFRRESRPFGCSALLCLLRHVRLLASSVIPTSQASQIVSISSQAAVEADDPAAALCIGAIDLLRRCLRTGGLSDMATMRCLAEYLPRVVAANKSPLSAALFSLLADLLEKTDPSDDPCFALLVSCAARCVSQSSEQSDPFLRMSAALTQLETAGFADERIFASIGDSLVDVALKQHRSILALTERHSPKQTPHLSPEALQVAIEVLTSPQSQPQPYLQDALLAGAAHPYLKPILESKAIPFLLESSRDQDSFWLTVFARANLELPTDAIQALYDRNDRCHQALFELVANKMSLDPELTKWVSCIFKMSLTNPVDDAVAPLLLKARLISNETPFDTILCLVKHHQSAIGAATTEIHSRLQDMLQAVRVLEDTAVTRLIPSLLHCVTAIASSAVSDAVTGAERASLFVKLYRFLNGAVINPDASTDTIRDIAKQTGAGLQTSISAFIISVQNADNRPVRRRLPNMSLAILIPQLVEAMETYEASLVRLSRQRKINFLHYFKLTPSRDFRIDRALVN